MHIKGKNVNELLAAAKKNKIEIDAGYISDMESDFPLDKLNVLVDGVAYSVTFNKYSDGGCELINFNKIDNDYESLLNMYPIRYDGENLFFMKTSYTDGSTAVVCETEYEPYANISINLGDYDMSLEKDEIFFDHNLSKDLKELFCELFCKCTLDSCEEVEFGPYNIKTQKAKIKNRLI